jgi:transcriptional regulator with XRE-family HTH domain
MKLGEVIRLWRKMSDLGVREVAADIGVSHGTLSRIERGEAMDGNTLAKVLVWLVGKHRSLREKGEGKR